MLNYRHLPNLASKEVHLRADAPQPTNIIGFDAKADDPLEHYWLPNRTYIPWKQMNRTAPCVLDSFRGPKWDPMNGYIQRQPSKEGILFIKIEKAASSTLAGVAARISRSLIHLTNTSTVSLNGTVLARPVCRVRLSHLWWIRTRKYSTRNKERSFLFTFLKRPEKRVLSEFWYFGHDIRDPLPSELPDDTTVIEYLKKSANSQLSRVIDKAPNPRLNDNLTKTEMAARVQTVMSELDFIGIVERMDESLVLLQLLLGLRPSDVLSSSSAKQSGGYIMFKNRCVYIPKHDVSPKVQSFIDSPEWKRMNFGDELLYEAVNANLDRFIDAIGRNVFQEAMEAFQRAKEQVRLHCPPVISPCTSNGTKVPREQLTKCYIEDSGCGFECLDSLFPENAE